MATHHDLLSQMCGRLGWSPGACSRSMVEAALLELHHCGEICVLDEHGDASKARVNLKVDHILRLPSQFSLAF